MARPSETQKLISSLGVFSARIDAVSREIGRTNASMKLLADREARFSADASNEIKRAMTEAMKAGMDQVAGSAVRSVEHPRRGARGAPESGVLPAPIEPGQPPMRGTDPGRVRPAEAPPGARRGGGVVPAEKHHYDYEDTWKSGPRGYRMENVQKDVGHKVTQMLQGRESRVMERIELDKALKLGELDPDMPYEDWWAKASTITEEAESGGVRAAARYGTARNLTGALAEGKGVKAALGAAFPAAAKVAGKALAAAGVADQVLDFATKQRETNRRWQQMTGDSNAAAFGERAKSQVFEWGMKGTMGAGQASELYAGAARMGLRGDDRGRALDFAVTNFKKHGMDVADSLALINTALESSNSNLSGLSRALDGVSHTAKAAGRNVEEARKAFGQRYEAVTQTMGGQAAVAVAAGQTEAAYSLGRGLDDVRFDTSTDAQRLQAITLGYKSVPAYLAAIKQSGGTRAAEGQAAVAAQFVKASGAGQVSARLLPEYEKRFGGPASGWNTGQTRQFGEAIAMESGMDPEVMQRLLERGGMSGVSAEKAPQVFAEILTGRLPDQLVAQTKEQADERNAHLLGRGDETRDQQTGGQDSGIIRGASFFGGGRSSIETSVSKGDVATTKKNIGFSSKAPAFGRHGKTQTLADARRLYLEKVTKEGGKAMADPKIEALLESGYKGKFIVDTAEGRKAVDFETAINHYWDQLRAGTAEIGEGESRGDTVAGAFGVDEDKSVDVTSDEKKAQGKTEDEEDYEGKVAGKEKGKGAGGETKGKVVIEMQPELRRLLGVRTHGDVVYTDPNAPRNTNATANDLGDK